MSLSKIRNLWRERPRPTLTLISFVVSCLSVPLATMAMNPNGTQPQNQPQQQPQNQPQQQGNNNPQQMPNFTDDQVKLIRQLINMNGGQNQQGTQQQGQSQHQQGQNQQGTQQQGNLGNHQDVIPPLDPSENYAGYLEEIVDKAEQIADREEYENLATYQNSVKSQRAYAGNPPMAEKFRTYSQYLYSAYLMQLELQKDPTTISNRLQQGLNKQISALKNGFSHPATPLKLVDLSNKTKNPLLKASLAYAHEPSDEKYAALTRAYEGTVSDLKVQLAARTLANAAQVYSDIPMSNVDGRKAQYKIMADAHAKLLEAYTKAIGNPTQQGTIPSQQGNSSQQKAPGTKTSSNTVKTVKPTRSGGKRNSTISTQSSSSEGSSHGSLGNKFEDKFNKLVLKINTAWNAHRGSANSVRIKERFDAIGRTMDKVGKMNDSSLKLWGDPALDHLQNILAWVGKSKPELPKLRDKVREAMDYLEMRMNNKDQQDSDPGSPSAPSQSKRSGRNFTPGGPAERDPRSLKNPQPGDSTLYNRRSGPAFDPVKSGTRDPIDPVGSKPVNDSDPSKSLTSLDPHNPLSMKNVLGPQPQQQAPDTRYQFNPPVTPSQQDTQKQPQQQIPSQQAPDTRYQFNPGHKNFTPEQQPPSGKYSRYDFDPNRRNPSGQQLPPGNPGEDKPFRRLFQNEGSKPVNSGQNYGWNGTLRNTKPDSEQVTQKGSNNPYDHIRDTPQGPTQPQKPAEEKPVIERPSSLLDLQARLKAEQDKFDTLCRNEKTTGQDFSRVAEALKGILEQAKLNHQAEVSDAIKSIPSSKELSIVKNQLARSLWNARLTLGSASRNAKDLTALKKELEELDADYKKSRDEKSFNPNAFLIKIDHLSDIIEDARKLVPDPKSMSIPEFSQIQTGLFDLKSVIKLFPTGHNMHENHFGFPNKIEDVRKALKKLDTTNPKPVENPAPSRPQINPDRRPGIIVPNGLRRKAGISLLENLKTIQKEFDETRAKKNDTPTDLDKFQQTALKLEMLLSQANQASTQPDKNIDDAWNKTLVILKDISTQKKEVPGQDPESINHTNITLHEIRNGIRNTFLDSKVALGLASGDNKAAVEALQKEIKGILTEDSRFNDRAHPFSKKYFYLAEVDRLENIAKNSEKLFKPLIQRPLPDFEDFKNRIKALRGEIQKRHQNHFDQFTKFYTDELNKLLPEANAIVQILSDLADKGPEKLVEEFKKTQEQHQHTVPPRDNSAKIAELRKDIDGILKGTHNPTKETDYNSKKANYDKNLAQLSKIVKETKDTNPSLHGFQTRINYLDKEIKLLSDNNSKENDWFKKVQSAMQKTPELLNEIDEQNRSRQGNSSQQPQNPVSPSLRRSFSSYLKEPHRRNSTYNSIGLANGSNETNQNIVNIFNSVLDDRNNKIAALQKDLDSKNFKEIDSQKKQNEIESLKKQQSVFEDAVSKLNEKSFLLEEANSRAENLQKQIDQMKSNHLVTTKQNTELQQALKQRELAAHDLAEENHRILDQLNSLSKELKSRDQDNADLNQALTLLGNELRKQELQSQGSKHDSLLLKKVKDRLDELEKTFNAVVDKQDKITLSLANHDTKGIHAEIKQMDDEIEALKEKANLVASEVKVLVPSLSKSISNFTRIEDQVKLNREKKKAQDELDAKKKILNKTKQSGNFFKEELDPFETQQGEQYIAYKKQLAGLINSKERILTGRNGPKGKAIEDKESFEWQIFENFRNKAVHFADEQIKALKESNKKVKAARLETTIVKEDLTKLVNKAEVESADLEKNFEDYRNKINNYTKLSIEHNQNYKSIVQAIAQGIENYDEYRERHLFQHKLEDLYKKVHEEVPENGVVLPLDFPEPFQINQTLKAQLAKYAEEQQKKFKALNDDHEHMKIADEEKMSAVNKKIEEAKKTYLELKNDGKDSFIKNYNEGIKAALNSFDKSLPKEAEIKQKPELANKVVDDKINSLAQKQKELLKTLNDARKDAKKKIVERAKDVETLKKERRSKNNSNTHHLNYNAALDRLCDAFKELQPKDEQIENHPEIAVKSFNTAYDQLKADIKKLEIQRDTAVSQDLKEHAELEEKREAEKKAEQNKLEEARKTCLKDLEAARKTWETLMERYSRNYRDYYAPDKHLLTTKVKGEITETVVETIEGKEVKKQVSKEGDVEKAGEMNNAKGILERAFEVMKKAESYDGFNSPPQGSEQGYQKSQAAYKDMVNAYSALKPILEPDFEIAEQLKPIIDQIKSCSNLKQFIDGKDLAGVNALPIKKGIKITECQKNELGNDFYALQDATNAVCYSIARLNLQETLNKEVSEIEGTVAKSLLGGANSLANARLPAIKREIADLTKAGTDLSLPLLLSLKECAYVPDSLGTYQKIQRLKGDFEQYKKWQNEYNFNKKLTSFLEHTIEDVYDPNLVSSTCNLENMKVHISSEDTKQLKELVLDDKGLPKTCSANECGFMKDHQNATVDQIVRIKINETQQSNNEKIETQLAMKILCDGQHLTMVPLFTTRVTHPDSGNLITQNLTRGRDARGCLDSTKKVACDLLAGEGTFKTVHRVFDPTTDPRQYRSKTYPVFITKRETGCFQGLQFEKNEHQLKAEDGFDAAAKAAFGLDPVNLPGKCGNSKFRFEEFGGYDIENLIKKIKLSKDFKLRAENNIGATKEKALERFNQQYKIYHDLIGNKGFWEKVTGQLLTKLAQMHNKKIVHRDLKPKNILINPGMEANNNLATIIDFGSAYGEVSPGVVKDAGMAYTPDIAAFFLRAKNKDEDFARYQKNSAQAMDTAGQYKVYSDPEVKTPDRYIGRYLDYAQLALALYYLPTDLNSEARVNNLEDIKKMRRQISTGDNNMAGTYRTHLFEQGGLNKKAKLFENPLGNYSTLVFRMAKCMDAFGKVVEAKGKGFKHTDLKTEIPEWCRDGKIQNDKQWKDAGLPQP